MNLEMLEKAVLEGRITIRAHESDYVYSRDTYQAGEVLHDDHNAIQAAGITYILNMLMADPVNPTPVRQYGITQIGLWSTAPLEVHKADLTDQYVSGASVVNVLYLTTTQPASQPVTLNQSRLYLDTAGATLLAIANFSNITKTNLLALTLQWTVTLVGL